MEAQAVLAESLRQHLQHPPGIALQLEDQHEVIGKADQKRGPVQMGLHHRLKPRVQHLVKIDVRQQRRDDASHAVANLEFETVLAYRRGERPPKAVRPNRRA